MRVRGRRQAKRSGRLVFLVALGMLPVKHARADEVATCTAAHLDAQRLRRAGLLVEATVPLRTCSQASCPALLSRDCVGWARENDAAVPDVLLSAKTSDGRDAPGVVARIDGATTPFPIDGRPVKLNPGKHVIRFESSAFAPVAEEVVLIEGEHRIVTARFAAAGAEDGAVELERPIPVSAWIVGGTTLAAATLFGVFAGLGASGHADLEERGCAPSCPSDDVAEVRRNLVVADVSLGVAAAGAVVTLVLVLTRPSVEPQTSWLRPDGVHFTF